MENVANSPPKDRQLDNMVRAWASLFLNSNANKPEIKKAGRFDHSYETNLNYKLHTYYRLNTITLELSLQYAWEDNFGYGIFLIIIPWVFQSILWTNDSVNSFQLKVDDLLFVCVRRIPSLRAQRHTGRKDMAVIEPGSGFMYNIHSADDTPISRPEWEHSTIL